MRNKISLAASSLLLSLVFLYSLGPGRDAVDRLPLICSLLLYTTSLLLPLQLGYRKDAISLLYTLVYGKLLSKKSKSEVKRTIGRKG